MSDEEAVFVGDYVMRSERDMEVYGSCGWCGAALTSRTTVTIDADGKDWWLTETVCSATPDGHDDWALPLDRLMR